MKGKEPRGRLVRPYAITGGRTGEGGPELALEAQVFATPKGLDNRHRYRWEAGHVIEAAEKPTALVEIAARLDVPLGVARVVVSDLIGDGALALVETEPSASSYTELLEKVLDGIRNL